MNKLKKERIPNLEDKERYQDSLVYQDSVGAKLFVGNQYSTSLFLSQFAQEIYC